MEQVGIADDDCAFYSDTDPTQDDITEKSQETGNRLMSSTSSSVLNLGEELSDCKARPPTPYPPEGARVESELEDAEVGKEDKETCLLSDAPCEEGDPVPSNGASNCATERGKLEENETAKCGDGKSILEDKCSLRNAAKVPHTNSSSPVHLSCNIIQRLKRFTAKTNRRKAHSQRKSPDQHLSLEGSHPKTMESGADSENVSDEMLDDLGTYIVSSEEYVTDSESDESDDPLIVMDSVDMQAIYNFYRSVKKDRTPSPRHSPASSRRGSKGVTLSPSEVRSDLSEERVRSSPSVSPNSMLRRADSSPAFLTNVAHQSDHCHRLYDAGGITEVSETT